MNTKFKQITIVEDLNKRNNHIKNPESLIDEILNDGEKAKNGINI